MKKMLTCIVISSIVVSNCAYDVTKGDYENENKYFERISNLCRNEKEITLNTTDLEQIVCKQILLTKDSTSFVRMESDIVEMIPTYEIYHISFPNYTAGFEGFLFGGLGGGFLGNLLSNPQEPGLSKGLSVLAGILVGGIIGIAAGIMMRPRTTIYLAERVN